MVLFISTNSPPKPWIAKALISMVWSWFQNPKGAKLITLTVWLTSREDYNKVKQSQQLKFIIDLSSLQVQFVKLLLYWQLKFVISLNLGVYPRQRQPRGLVKLKNVKFRRVTVLVEPGLAPQRSQVYGANTTPSRITESIRELSPTNVKIPSATKIPMQMEPQMSLFFMLVVLLINYLLQTKPAMKKIGYVVIIGALTTTAVSACYWQANRYLQARHRWDTIRNQLNKTDPDDLQALKSPDVYPYKYVAVRGTLAQGFQRVERMRNGRMGYLVVRKLLFGKDQSQEIVALQGWCESGFDYESKNPQTKQWRGILREKEKKDYVHTHFAKQELQKYKMSTYIDLESLREKFQIKPTHLSQNYYIQLLRPLDSTDHDSFPYQYSVDNFQLPYLTPDKHLSYATFWGCTSIVGFVAILRSLRIK